MIILIFVVVLKLLPLTTIFPYTTLFRSGHAGTSTFGDSGVAGAVGGRRKPWVSLARNWGDWTRQTMMTTTALDRKSTRLNSSHVEMSYAVFCLKTKSNHTWNNAVLKTFI